MTPDQFAYLLTLAGVIPTIWLGLAVATIPSRIGHYSKKDARFFRNVVRLNLVLGVGSEYFVLAALSRGSERPVDSTCRMDSEHSHSHDNVDGRRTRWRLLGSSGRVDLASAQGEAPAG